MDGQNSPMGECDGNVELRRATAADAPAIAIVHVRSWQQAYRGLIADNVLDALDVETRERFWQQMLESQREIAPLLAVVDDRVAGLCPLDLAKTTTPRGRLVRSMPSTFSPNAGIAALAATCCSRRSSTSCSAGYNEASLWVLKTNERAVRFYEAAGGNLEGIERTESFRGAELHEVRYRKLLFQPANSAAKTAMRTGTPFATCLTTSERGPFATSGETSMPSFIGPGCMNQASGPANASRRSSIW